MINTRVPGFVNQRDKSFPKQLWAYLVDGIASECGGGGHVGVVVAGEGIRTTASQAAVPTWWMALQLNAQWGIFSSIEDPSFMMKLNHISYVVLASGCAFDSGSNGIF